MSSIERLNLNMSRSEWAQANNLKLNRTKAVEVIFSSRLSLKSAIHQSYWTFAA